MSGRCEDYPCCGHTDGNPCGPQWYDKPGAFDTSRPGNEHALCDHENGDCQVNDGVFEDEDDEGRETECDVAGCDYDRHGVCRDCGEETGVPEDTPLALDS